MTLLTVVLLFVVVGGLVAFTTGVINVDKAKADEVVAKIKALRK